MIMSFIYNSTDQQQYESLSEKLLNKQDELKYCIFLTENCLYLLWAHLDFFMLRAISVNPLQFNKTLNKAYDCKYIQNSLSIDSNPQNNKILLSELQYQSHHPSMPVGK